MIEPNPILRDLLLREAHLRLSREHLKPVWAQKEAELRAVETAKPFFMPVISNRKREEYERKLATARESVRALRSRLESIERIEPHVKQLIEEQIEEALREESPQFARALAARHQREDWSRSLERYADKIQEFVRALGDVRNHACSGYGRMANTYSQAAQHAFGVALDAAAAVAAEVKFANKVSETQARIFLENGFTTRPLPKLVETDYATGLKQISALPQAEAQQQFDQLIEQTKKLHEAGINELKAQAESVEHLQAIEVHNHLLTAWERGRAEIASQVFAGDTEKVVAETESLLLANAQCSGAGRLEEVAA